MVKNFYEILEIESEASKAEIKRAYFKLVRKYPPDRYEKEFMEIREAYETLSNEKTRKEYDSINFLPVDIKESYDSARELIEEYDDLNGAIKILEKILKIDSELLIIKSLLGETCLKNNNTGKAIKIYEELTEAEPENAAFAGYLANSYLARGWQKKAIAAYNRAIELDSDNISLWMGLSDAYIKSDEYSRAREVLEKALNKGDNISASTTIYLKFIMIEIALEMNPSIQKYLDKLIDIAVNNVDIKDNVAWTLSHIARHLLHTDKFEEAKRIIDAAIEILPEEEEIVKAQKEIENFTKYIDEFEKLESDKKIKHEVAGLVAIEVLPESMVGPAIMDNKTAGYFYEFEIITEYNKFQSSIQKLKKNYPELYSIRADFFDKVQNSIERKKMLLDYEKQINQIRNTLGGFFGLDDDEDDDDYDEDLFDEDWEYQEPFVREEPKIGRNDPCTCGSGKKYKKCCGK